jgi:hypothetical protein
MNPLNLFPASLIDVVHNFYDPVVVTVSDCRVAIARYLVVEFRDRSWDKMRVEVPRGRTML